MHFSIQYRPKSSDAHHHGEWVDSKEPGNIDNGNGGKLQNAYDTAEAAQAAVRASPDVESRIVPRVDMPGRRKSAEE